MAEPEPEMSVLELIAKGKTFLPHGSLRLGLTSRTRDNS